MAHGLDVVAVRVTHDVVSTDGEFSQRRMQDAIGWHVWHRCSDWEASEVLADQVVCRLHAVLCDLIPGGVSKQIYAAHAAQTLNQLKPSDAVQGGPP